jgi:hypothetical protein
MPRLHDPPRHRSLQDAHGIFPRVAWVVPDERREAQLWNWIHGNPQLDTELFTVATTAQFQDLLRQRRTDKPNG